MNKSVFIFLILCLIHGLGISQSQLSTVDLSDINALKDSIIFNKAVSDLQQFVNEDQIDRAELLSDQLIKLGTDIEYNNGLGQVFRLKGIISNALQRNSVSDKSFEKATSYFEKTNDRNGLAVVSNDRFIIEQNKGNLEKAADYLMEAKLYREQLNDSVGLSGIYNNLAIIYKELKNIPNSEKYYLKSINLRKQLKIDGIGLVMNNLALLYTEKGNLSEAKKLLPEALKINKAENDLRHTAQSYSIMAKAAMYGKEYEAAKKYYDTTLCVGSQANYKLIVVNAKQQLGIIALEQGEYKKSEELLKIARDGFKKVNVVSLLLKNYKYSFKLDSTRGNLLGAIGWQKEYQKLSDKRLYDISAKKVEKAKSRYEAELTQLKLIDAQEKREQKTKESLFRYRLLTFISMAVIAVILVFMILIIKTRKDRKRYINELNESNQVKNKLFSIISHDLKNEIHGLEGSLNLMKEDVISTEEFKEIVPLLANRTHQTSILLNNLLNWSKSQMKELNPKPTTFDITEVISNKFTFFKPKAEKKDIKLINKLDPTMIFADKDMFGIVAQNLIANAIKFCNSGDSIALVSIEKEDHYEICFEDTGVGIDPSNLNKLFAEDTFTTNGTQNETGTGLGLRICKELIELNHGNIKVESTLGEGSTFFISLPKAAA
ncbi:tetratricopeptide repeat-containing sensor histidine kinase [Aquimarina sp. 2201CG14-23]|uniref:tetratricopeptide repeat-containing sensor histidine kinase n=1 Tax=Aquimarina mycalae TaxID=3040073 RepID=UPI002477FEC6|nr:tetratricopeptide repeat-containing sensor histidine kinase [Aquimarina sp. 2201CG14-23]MDH7444211.1 tetratricopeptide repeat-containing sensor histidine kinase [Aquimarina sp. 2201CG14-23]